MLCVAQSVISLMSSISHILLAGTQPQWRYQFIILIDSNLQALRWKSQRIQSQNLVLTPIIHSHQHCSVTTTLTVSWAPLQSSLSSQLCLCSRVSGPSCSLTPKKRENSSPHRVIPTGHFFSIQQVPQH